MKRLLLVLAALAVLASPVNAGTQLGLTTDLLNDYHPVTGVLGIEWRGARLSVGVGAEDRAEAAADLIFRHQDGIYFGIGAFAERADSYFESATSDTTITPISKPKKHGRGPKGRKKTKTVIATTYVSIADTDLGLSPSLLMGIAGSKVYAESRVIFGGPDYMRGQFSIGLWW